MQKRLETDLISLAHSILKMKNKEDVFALKEKSKAVYEKLSLLAFVEEYINSTPNVTETKEALISKIEKGLALQNADKEPEVIVTEEVGIAGENITKKIEEVPAEKVEAEEVKEKAKATIEVDTTIEQPFDELEEILHSKEEVVNNSRVVSDVVKVEENKILSLEEELQDTLSVDEMATLFDGPIAKSLNDRLATNIQIGLNDRIAFVKNLFDGSQEDFNRVVSQLNTYATEKEAKKFINKMVKPDYNWSEQEALEARFIEIVARKFA